MSLLDPPVEKPQKSRAMAFTVAKFGLATLYALAILVGTAWAMMAFFIFARWARGLLPLAAALAILLLIVAVVAGLGVTGTSWFDRNHAGFAAPQTR